MGKQPRPKKELPAWTKQKPDIVTVNPPADGNKGGSFKHTAPKPQHNFTKKSPSGVTMPVGSTATVLNFKTKNRKVIK